jgi:hypothetical protein
MGVEGLSVEELDQTPVLWEYWPLMTEDREGAHKGLETKALRKPMPCSRSRECVFGMNSMSSLRMSSARMKAILGLAVTLWACALLISPITLSMVFVLLCLNAPHIEAERDESRMNLPQVLMNEPC